ncbi:TPA: CoA ester lyase [Campylobacter coli]|nr:CoA ester lyase [Campylobacter coli]HEB9305658.1 CoA ester lyase [Campylobacter coli]HEB9317532.1 CoA ester lyase [Campylobacter coli]
MKAKSFLFVPSIYPERFIKALQSGANQIIIDLEDSVEEAKKEVGRKNIADFSSQCVKNNDKFLIRINETQSAEFQKDLSLISTIKESNSIVGIVLPKAQNYEDIDILSKFELPIIPIIESALGVENLDDIARHPSVLALSFGSLDMTLDLNLQEGEGKNFILNSIRTQIVLKSVKYNLLSPINGVYPDIKNIDGLKEDLLFAKSMGFGGSLCIHPNQVVPINEVFSPSAQQIAWAKEILSLRKNSNDIIFNHNGMMVDLPVIKKAEQILLDSNSNLS